MISDDEEFSDEISDDMTDYDPFETTDDEEDEDEEMVQPVHFRECLRLLDAALNASNPPVLPRWCANERLKINTDPMILIDGYRRPLSLPMDKSESRRFIQKAAPLDLKMNLLDGVTFSPSVYEIPATSFRLLSGEWKKQIEPFLKRSCVSRVLQLDPHDIELKVSQLLLLDSYQFPREISWSKEKTSANVIAKLFVTLPSSSVGGKETIRYFKEKHTFDLSNVQTKNSFFFTIVPIGDQCKHEIDLVCKGNKLMLVYDIVSLTPTSFYKMEIEENISQRVQRVFDLWIEGLKKNYHGYSSKIVVPFSDLFHCGQNPLLHGVDRLIGSILRRSIEREEKQRFLLYQGKIQPNRSSDGTVHACRLLTQLQLINRTKDQRLLQNIDASFGNCNETYSGNIFLRRTISEQGNFVPIEQYLVPVWCLVPVHYQYELFLDHLPVLLKHLEEILVENRHEALEILRWLLTTPKKIQFNTKSLLHQILRLPLDDDLMEILQLLFEHQKFQEQFFPMAQQQDYDDLIFLLQSPHQIRFQLFIDRIVQQIFKRNSRHHDRIKDAIKLIGVFATEQVDRSFLLVLIHQLLTQIFQANQSIPSIIDLTNLLALLSLFLDAFGPSCQIISQQIIRQMKITSTTTTNSSNLTCVLRTVLVPTLIHIYRQLIDEQQKSGKRKRDSTAEFPPWFISLYQTCLSLLDSFCKSPLPVPFYGNTFSTCQCSICKEFLLFLESSTISEQTFLISPDQIEHFNVLVQKFNPLIILTKSMTADQRKHQIHVMKMSKYDEELWRENNLLRSILNQIPLNKLTEDQSVPKTNKRFKQIQ